MTYPSARLHFETSITVSTVSERVPAHPLSSALGQMHTAERARYAHRRGRKTLDELGFQAIPEGCGAPVRGPVESEELRCRPLPPP